MSGIGAETGTDRATLRATVTVHHLCTMLQGLRETELRAWIVQEWVRPQDAAGEPRFSEADVARIRLILDLRNAMELQEEAIPVVLGLVDQLYAERVRVRSLCDAIRSAGLTEAVWHHLDAP